MKIQGSIIIIIMCGFILLLMAIKVKSEILLNGVFRGLYSSAIIIVSNYFFQTGVIPMEIGLNPITLLTCIMLGFPGLILLFGINFLTLL